VADLADVTALLANLAEQAIYPKGNSQPSVANMDVRVYEGWPISTQLDLDMAGQILTGTPPTPHPRPGGKVANVSVYPMPGAAADVFQILDDTYTIVDPNYGLTAPTVSGNEITVTGAPVAGEYLTVILDNLNVASSSQQTLVAILNDLVAQINAFGIYTAITDGVDSITVTGWAYMTVRQGSVGTLAKVTHRQRQAVMVTVWAPDHVTRTTLAAAIDVLVKATLISSLPDTSQVKLTYSRTNVSDEMQAQIIYRRDLVYEAEYATLQQFPGYVITSAQFQIQGGNWYMPTVPPTITTDP
jgi:hypothetical protein